MNNNGTKNELDSVPLWTRDKKRKSLPPKEFELTNRLALNESLHRLRYPGLLFL